MSMPDIERLFDTHGLEGKGGMGSPYEFVADKFMHVDKEIEIEVAGKKIKKRVLDVEARTELNSPVAFSASQCAQIYLARKFKREVPEYVTAEQDLVNIFHQRTQINMINKDRAGRKEAKEILSAYFGGQRLNSTDNLAAEVLKK